MDNFVYVQWLCTDYEHGENKHSPTDEMYNGETYCEAIWQQIPELNLKHPVTQQFHFYKSVPKKHVYIYPKIYMQINTHIPTHRFTTDLPLYQEQKNKKQLNYY